MKQKIILMLGQARKIHQNSSMHYALYTHTHTHVKPTNILHTVTQAMCMRVTRLLCRGAVEAGNV